ncbi:2-C-methyl-D-erythritol 2,4-cyclodiphosphate synthase [Cyclonatronum proteinivorum]|uniref:Bifunctional enzyme IspD/IspF n=2 Tax=Cyclonatronum proteinivorum TaxID=1457365 RepID=A0A345UIH9_9BACT|nr:2-C-methyl-D-erythritol 2,4-cyclodiphosphate synthase [Cyclonatronum proteinivorum]
MGYSVPKVYLTIGGKTIMEHTLRVFLKLDFVSRIFVPVSPEMMERAEEIVSALNSERITLVEGGSERLYSISNALSLIEDEELTAVHDMVRPLVSTSDILKVTLAAQHSGAAILVTPSDNTLKRVDGEQQITGTADRKEIWQAQTPQVFRTSLLKEAYQQALDNNVFGTDDASLVERTGVKVSAVEGERTNIKITRKEDLDYAAFIMKKNQNKPFRIGFGYDTHRLKAGRALILGGVNIPFEKGLDGHSDADVLIHAIIDAMFGALALGDIGSHFPDTDPAFKGADSRELLREANKRIEQEGYEIGNVDATIVAEKPKLRQYIDQMRELIALDLGTDADYISVKATTSERIGFVGRQEGMSASSVVLLTKK